ncbi:hypothetical protein EVAR_2222_1 [Eumeta japonica]|uniref:Uncharacterized protein n=1 Tax=Eumeta variegata TaxID=151549 RepID=A0A4C1SG80_EUMVA|nr:hypothetical protein EVAR_2222_1 [Eumeta japonica]
MRRAPVAESSACCSLDRSRGVARNCLESCEQLSAPLSVKRIYSGVAGRSHAPASSLLIDVSIDRPAGV